MERSRPLDQLIRAAAINPLRQRLIEDMNMRRFLREIQRNYIRDVGHFASFLGRSPHTATAKDMRRFQIEQHDTGVRVECCRLIAVYYAEGAIACQAR